MNMLVIGDSYAAGVGSIQNWLDLLEIPKNLRQGDPGSTVKDWAEDKEGCLTAAKSTPAPVVLISLMGNDAAASVADGNVTADEVLSAMEQMLKVVQAFTNDPNRRQILAFLPVDPHFGCDKYTKKAIPLIRRALALVCKSEGVLFIDLGLVLDHMCFDKENIHPNATGQARMARKIAEVLGEPIP